MGVDDELRNKGQDLKGRAKEAAGAATDDDELKAEGQTDQTKAGVKDKLDDAEDKIKDKIDDIL